MQFRQGSRLPPGQNMLVAPISSCEIVILGGGKHGHFSDGYILNVLDDTVERVYDNSGFRFFSVGN